MRGGEGKTVPVVEPVVLPAPEPDAWTVPETAPAEPVPEPELPGPLVEQLTQEVAHVAEVARGSKRFQEVPHPSGHLVWAGVFVCMTVIVGGWLWSLRYSLRLPVDAGSQTALDDAIASIRDQAATFRTTIGEAKTIVSEAAAKSTDDDALTALKAKVIEAAEEEPELIP